MTERRRGAVDLGHAIDRLAGLLAGASELDWPGVVHAAADEIEDLRRNARSSLADRARRMWPEWGGDA